MLGRNHDHQHLAIERPIQSLWISCRPARLPTVRAYLSAHDRAFSGSAPHHTKRESSGRGLRVDACNCLKERTPRQYNAHIGFSSGGPTNHEFEMILGEGYDSASHLAASRRVPTTEYISRPDTVV